MAIANTIIRRGVFGNLKYVIGKSVISGGTNTGDAATGLDQVDIFIPITGGSSQKGIAVNETFPLASGDVTIVNESNNATTYWIAVSKT
jgi:hypothetical protein